VASYGQYCPVAHAAEILTERWTPLIIRELLSGIQHFNALERGLPGISRALLARRLRGLEAAGIIERRRDHGGRVRSYHLTEAGQELQQVVDALGAWGVRWAFAEPRSAECDPGLLLWWMLRRIAVDKLPPDRVIIEFEFRGGRAGRFWLVLRGEEASLCLEHPGFDVSVWVVADVVTFYRVWLGRISLSDAIRAGAVKLDGLPAVVRAFPTWFTWSPMADLVRARLAARSRSRRPTARTTRRDSVRPRASRPDRAADAGPLSGFCP
jgi:DNA-binding HxlR family transcriptional regulator